MLIRRIQPRSIPSRLSFRTCQLVGSASPPPGEYLLIDWGAGVAILQVNPFLKRVQNGKPPSSQGVPQRAVSRLTREFTDVHVIGTGSFGEVYRGRLKIDGVTYAVKRIRQSLNRSSGVNAIQLQLREVHCLSFLASRCGHCPNILR